MLEILIIGAGVAGIGAALELADRGYKVILIEQETLGFGSSGRNPGRMGHGFHYVDPETAIMYLRASIQVQRKFPGYLIGQDEPFEHPLRHGRYFITKNSDNSPDEILQTYQKIKQEYERLIAEDPQNAVFGPTEKFFRILDPKEYEGLVNPDIVATGIETSEHLFDWQKFSKDIRQKIIENKNITLIEHTQVTHIEKGKLGESRFLLHTKTKNNETRIFRTDFLINSTWQNIEKLNDQVGIRMIPGARTNRLKCLLIVKLPESLIHANSMFFCMGQHCMFSNMGNGYGMMTFAQVTNMEASSDLELSEQTQRLLNNKATYEEKIKIASQMQKGVSQYIPEMSKAKIVDVRYGIVQTAGKLNLQDLTNPNSNFHKRDYDGIREEQIGLISNPCMKLFYFLRNGQVVSGLLDAQIRASLWNKQALYQIEKKSQKSLQIHPEIKRTIRDNLDRFTGTSSFGSITPTFFMQVASSTSLKITSMILFTAGFSMLTLVRSNASVSQNLGRKLAWLGIAAFIGTFFTKKHISHATAKNGSSTYINSIVQTMFFKRAIVKEIASVSSPTAKRLDSLN